MREKDPRDFLPLHRNWFHILLSLVGAAQHGYGIMDEPCSNWNASGCKTWCA
jgi:hypothetical protein